LIAVRALSSSDLDRLKQAMLLGLNRQPLKVPEPLLSLGLRAPALEQALTALALAGQQERFERPLLAPAADPVPAVARRLHQDPRPIVPSAPQRAMMRLANVVEKSHVGPIVCVAARRIARAGFRLHPFDLPRLMSHLRDEPRCLGAAERAYLGLTAAGAATAQKVVDGDISPESWTEFPRADRLAFLQNARRKDPVAARALLEGSFASEPAAMRTDLLRALEIGLSVDDLPFLESVAGDRAEGVRDAAAALIAAVPGTDGFSARLADAARCFVREKRSGILSRIGLGDAAVAFKPPPSANPAARPMVLARLFAGLSAADVAAAAEITAADVINALPPDEDVIFAAFFDKAVRDDDRDTMLLLAKARLAIADTRPAMLATILASLARDLSDPVPVDFGEALLASDVWHSALQRFVEGETPAKVKDDGTLIWTAALLPAALAAPLHDRLSSLLPTTSHGARTFIDFMLALEASIQQRGSP
jgi:hypothetical protein